MPRIALGTLANIQVGYQAKSSIHEDAQGKYRLIQSKNFDSFHHLQSNNLIAFLPDRKPETYSVSKGDILFQARGVAHFACCIEEDLKDTLAAGSFYILHVKNKDILPQYLAWWLNQAPAQAYFHSEARGAGISFIAKDTLSLLKIHIPALSVQEKVVKIIRLAEHEQVLLDRLASLRFHLAQAVCIKAIQEQER